MKPSEITKLLNLTGWSQAQLARELDVSRATVCKWLSGDNPVSGPAKTQMRAWLEYPETIPEPARASA